MGCVTSPEQAPAFSLCNVLKPCSAAPVLALQQQVASQLGWADALQLTCQSCAFPASEHSVGQPQKTHSHAFLMVPGLIHPTIQTSQVCTRLFICNYLLLSFLPPWKTKGQGRKARHRTNQ